MKKRYVALAMFLSIVIGNGSPALAFQDVADEWFAAPVDRLIARGAIDATRPQFEPNRFVTRAEFIKMLVKAFGFSLMQPTAPTFQDVPQYAWFFSVVETAKTQRIIDPRPNFYPKKTVNRAEAVAMITRALNLPLNAIQASPMSDVPSGAWFSQSVHTAWSANIVRGYEDNTFRPDNSVNRAEAAAFLSRALDVKDNTGASRDEPPMEPPTEPPTEPPIDPPHVETPQEPDTRERVAVSTIPLDITQDPIPTGGLLTPLLPLVITNQSGEELFLHTIHIKKIGIFGEQDIDGAVLLDEQQFVRGSKGQFSEGRATVNAAHNPISIGAWETIRVRVAISFKRGAGSGSLALSIDTADDLIVKNRNGETVDVQGNFPLTAAPTAVLASQQLGAINITPLDVPHVGPDLFVEQGRLNLFIARWNIADKNNADDMELLRLTLTNIGSAEDNQFTGFRLLDRNNTVLATHGPMRDGKIRFLINAPAGSQARGGSGGYIVRKGTERELKVVTDVAPQSAIEERMLDLVIDSAYDVQAIGQLAGTGIPLAADLSFPIRNANNIVGIRAGSFSITKAAQLLAGSVAAGATNIPLATFDIRPTSEALEIRALQIAILRKPNESITSGSHIPRGSIRIRDAAGNQLAIIDAADKRLYGDNVNAFATADGILTGSPNGTGIFLDLTQFYTIDPNQSGRLNIVADIAESATNQDKYTIMLQGYRILRGTSQTPQEIHGNVETPIATGNTIAIQGALTNQ